MPTKAMLSSVPYCQLQHFKLSACTYVAQPMCDYACKLSTWQYSRVQYNTVAITPTLKYLVGVYIRVEDPWRPPLPPNHPRD